MKKIVCAGGVTVDIMILPIEALPEPGSLLAVENIEMHVGGCAANTSLDLHKLGIPVSLACKIGEDDYGDYILKSAAKSGLNTKGIVVDRSVKTTVSIVCIQKNGQRSFIYLPGSTAKLNRDDIPAGELGEGDIIFITSALLLDDFDGEPCADTLREAQEKNIFTAMDTSWDISGTWLPKIRPSLKYLDLFMPSYDEAVLLTGEKDPDRIADVFARLGVKNVIIKTGSDGARFLEENGRRYTLPSYRGVEVLDTTGAGDAFCAGMLAGLAQDWTMEESGRFANAVAAHCIGKIGASTGIVSAAEILQFMEKNEA